MGFNKIRVPLSQVLLVIFKETFHLSHCFAHFIKTVQQILFLCGFVCDSVYLCLFLTECHKSILNNLGSGLELTSRFWVHFVFLTNSKNLKIKLK